MLGDLGKIIVAKGFKRLPKVQKIARSGQTGLVPLKNIFSRWDSNVWSSILDRSTITKPSYDLQVLGRL